MQTAFAACKLPFAAQQKKVATISKKKVAGGKKKIYRKASMRKYSQKKLNQIMRTLERKFLSADNSSAWRNVVGFGIGDNSIDITLRWNTKEKQQEFRNQIYNSSVIKFGDKLDPIINNKTGVSSYNGISIKAETPSYPWIVQKSKSLLPTIVAKNSCMAKHIASQPKVRMVIGLFYQLTAYSRLLGIY